MGLANGDMVTWNGISSLLDIDFIHGNIYGRSCMKIWFSPKASFNCRVLLFPASVCLSVCVSITSLSIVHAVIHDPFKLGSSNLDQRCKTHWLRSILFWQHQTQLMNQLYLTDGSLLIMCFWPNWANFGWFSGFWALSGKPVIQSSPNLVYTIMGWFSKND